MKISYNWLKWYIPECPPSEEMYDIFTYHLCEVEGIEKREDGDVVFDINILPNRAHDLLSHQGIARELASLLNIKYVDPTPKYKIPESKPTNLKIKVDSDKCRRYMGRIVRNVNVGPSPDWVKAHLESIGQRSINNAVDGANITMYDCGQPIHCFDLDKVTGALIIRMAKEGEEITTLDNKRVILKTTDLVIADEKNVLAIAGVKGGKVAEVDENTKNIIIEVANFDPISVRKTGRGAGIFTDALKRFENDLSPTLCDFAMLEMSGLFIEYGFTEFEDVVDIYPNKQEDTTLKFRKDKMSKMLGLDIKTEQIEDILTRYNFKFKNSDGVFDIEVPAMRLDLVIEEDMAEEIGRVLGYDKVENKIPKIDFKPKVNNTFAMMSWARNKFLSEGYSEVMTYTFTNKGEVSVMQSASDKKFLRTNIGDGLKESLKLNKLNLPLLDSKEVKVFEIGNVFKKDKEETHIAWSEKNEVKEKSLEEYIKENSSLEEYGYFSTEKFLVLDSSVSQVSSKENSLSFKVWSAFPFIARDIAVWVPDEITSDEVRNLIKDNTGDLVVKGPELFDQFKKDGKTSYAFRTVFQSQERTLTDAEINEIMTNIANKIKDKNGWQVR
ncbi:MAG: Phenylalanine--tRNA ligase beta subunit [Patescibacteria group bacterium]|nr:Phenylalanine--tRNA ligase beta subunit [Patescibacteria group bacterium]